MNNPLAQLATIAAKDLGLHEEGTSNAGSQILKFQRATNLRGQGWPWCAAAVDYWVEQFLLLYPGLTSIALNRRPVTAAAFGLIDWGTENDCLLITTDKIPPYAPLPGDIVVYTFSHCGIVSREVENGVFEAIEGNTDGSGSRDGGDVARRTRSVRLIKMLIRMPVRALSAGRPVTTAGDLPQTSPSRANVALGSATTALISAPPVPGLPAIPTAAYDLILQAEGMDQPFVFPGGDSGISLGRGYDLSAETRAELYRDWATFLTRDQLDRLAEAIGKSGAAAKALCRNYRDIVINAHMADCVFYTFTVPKYYHQTLGAFPGVEKLPVEAQGALLSLIFNRGPSMTDRPPQSGKRKEMRAIRAAVAEADLEKIANQLRSMKRLWRDKGLDGLLARRDAEATLVELAI